MARHEQPPERRRSGVWFWIAMTWTNLWSVLTVTILFLTVLDLLTGEPDATDGFYAFAFSAALAPFALLMLRPCRARPAPVQQPTPVRQPAAHPHDRLPPPTSAARQPL